MSAVSLLDAVAQQEKALLNDIEAARAEARREVEAAHADASALLIENQHEIERETQTRRKKAAQEREHAIARIEEESKARLASIREQAAGRFDRIVDEVITRVLPSAKGSQS